MNECFIDVVCLDYTGDADNESHEEETANGNALLPRELKGRDDWNRQKEQEKIQEYSDDAKGQHVVALVDAGVLESCQGAPERFQWPACEYRTKEECSKHCCVESQTYHNNPTVPQRRARTREPLVKAK